MEVKNRSREPLGSRSEDGATGLHSEPFPDTLPALVERSARLFGSRAFLLRRDSRDDSAVTFEQLATDVRRVAAGLIAAGIQRGDRIGLMSENRYEWLLADLASASVGAVDVPRGVDTAPAEMEFILEHSGCRLVFVEGDRLASEIERKRDQLPRLEVVCSLDRDSSAAGVLALTELMARGDAWLRDNPDGVEQRSAEVSPDDLLTIVYTSGTTANPKGVMLTHDNVLSNVRTVNQVFEFSECDRFLSVLPPWHMYERIMDYIALSAGSELVYTDRRVVKEDLAATQPTIFAAVPRFWESIHDALVTKCQKLPPRKRSLMRFALESCRRHGAGEPKWPDRLLRGLLALTLIKKFRAVTGGKLRIAVSGGGALPAHVDQCLLGLGLPLLNGYGLTETSPVVSVRQLGSNRWGTIGPTLPETEVEIRDDAGTALPAGETGIIWIRGPGVMQGYYRNEERTREVLSEEWFNSGDLGTIEPDGHIRITGRAKDTIVLAGGENVEPERIETAVVLSRFIEQAMVVGQDQKALGALLVISEDNLEQEIPRGRWGLRDHLVTSEEVTELLRSEINALLCRDRGFRSVERIVSFRAITESMTPENGLLTPTLKVKRHVVTAHHEGLLSDLFS